MFGNSTAGGAYVPGMSDHIVMIEGRSKVFLGGPPLVKMATGEESDDEELGGASMHARVSGLADYLASDETDAIRIGRAIVSRLNQHKHGPPPSMPADDPVHDPDELLGMASADLRVPFDPRDVLARVVDGSRFDEFKPLYGPSLVTGWASIHGYPIGVLANHRGVLFSEESNKATQFIQLCNQTDVPLAVPAEHHGVHGGQGIRTARHHQGRRQDDQRRLELEGPAPDAQHRRVLRSRQLRDVRPGLQPALSVRVAQRRAPRSWDRRNWPGCCPSSPARGPSRGARTSTRRPTRPCAPWSSRRSNASRCRCSSRARLYDDGIIDPRDTRHVLGMCLSVIHNTPIHGTRGYGVFRM